MKKSIAFLAGIIISIASMADDSVYLAGGSHLVPITGNDISIKKEILTITLTDGGYTDIDVYYEFFNPGVTISVAMGFEAKAPENAGNLYKINSKNDGHPFIEYFQVRSNGLNVPYMTGIVHENSLRRIENFDPEHNEDVPFSYGYTFSVRFEHGINKIRHTYRIRNSYGPLNVFHIPYSLTSAAGWSGRPIGDFSLIINSVTSAKHFCIGDKSLPSGECHVIGRDGKVRKADYFDEKVTEICLRNAAVIWQASDFTPREDLDIYSADQIILDGLDKILCKGLFYDRSIPEYQSYDKLSAAEKKILKNLPYASRGYVFKDRELSEFFNGVWWYMPNPDWDENTDGFTIQEKELIAKFSK